MDVMRSVLGMVVLLAIAFLLSVNKKKISLRTVGAALVLQVVIGGIMLWLPPGRWVAEKVAFGVHKVMAYSDAGSAFIFGSLVGPKMDTCLMAQDLSLVSGYYRQLSSSLHW